MKDAKIAVVNTAVSTAFMTHQAQLRRFLSLRSGEGNVDDLLQELWFKAQAVDTLVERPLAYLFAMADRLVLDSRRGASRSRSRDGDWAYVHDRLSGSVEPAIADRILIARQRLDETDAVLKAVGDRAMRIFRLFRLEGMAQRAIAEQLGVSVSTVEKDLRKTYDALLALRERADEE